MAEVEYNPWVELIKWSNKEKKTPTRRWNGFQLFMVEARGKKELAEQMREGTYRKGGKGVEYLSDEELAQAKSFFEEGWDFSIGAYIDFEGATFDKVDFRGVFFSYYVSFAGSTFSSNARFSNATFLSYARFEDVTFSSYARFENVIFSSSAWFSNATFSSYAWFKNVTFSYDARFKNVTFLYDARFDNATFSSYVNFSCTENQIIKKISFRGATFENHPPKLYGRSLHEDTDFDFKTLPPIPAYKDYIKNHINAYERLRIQAEGLGMIEARRRFITAEMACRTAVCDWGFEWAMRGAFGAASNYGTAIGRPLIILAVLWFFIFAGWDIYQHQNAIANLTTAHAATFTFGKMMPFIGSASYLGDETVKAISNAPFILITLTNLFSICSLALLFLFGLGLQSKFRVGV